MNTKKNKTYETILFATGILGGLFGRHNNQSQYGQPPPQAVYEQAPPKKHGLSTGGALALGAGAGLGAFLIGDAIEDHIQNDEFQAYEQGKLLTILSSFSCSSPAKVLITGNSRTTIMAAAVMGGDSFFCNTSLHLCVRTYYSIRISFPLSVWR